MSYPLAEALGRPFVDFCLGLGGLTVFFARALRRCFTPPLRARPLIRQMQFIGVKSLPIATLTALFVGMVMVLQTGVTLMKFGMSDYVPGIAFIALAREMAPVFTAVVVGARVAASMTAEIGSMAVTEQLDAMDALNVDPIRYLVVPRFWAAVIMMPAVSLYSMLAALLGGMAVAASSLGIGPRKYYMVTQQFAHMTDFATGLSKTFFFGALIALVGCHYGFRASGGAEGVGRATTTSVVVTLVLILVWDYIHTSWAVAITGLLVGQ